MFWLVVVSPKISRKLVFLPINLNKFVLLEVDTWKRSICETISHRILMFNVFHYKFNNQLKNIFCLHFQPFTVWYTTMLISEFHIKNILKKEKISRLIRTIRMICISAFCKNLEYSLNQWTIFCFYTLQQMSSVATTFVPFSKKCLGCSKSFTVCVFRERERVKDEGKYMVFFIYNFSVSYSIFQVRPVKCAPPPLATWMTQNHALSNVTFRRIKISPSWAFKEIVSRDWAELEMI